VVRLLLMRVVVGGGQLR